jgi:hypothetical protein
VSASGHSLPMHSAPMPHQVRNYLKADEGRNGKTTGSRAHYRVKPARLNAISPANTDKVARWHGCTLALAVRCHGVIADARVCGTVKVLDALSASDAPSCRRQVD